MATPERRDGKKDEPLPTGRDKERQVKAMFDRIAPRYDLLNRIMTFGMDVGWRRRTVAELSLASGDTILDVACGTGDLIKELAAAGYRAIGLDFSWEMLTRAPGARVQGDALRLPIADDAVDGITCGFALRNVSDLARLFEEFGRALRPGGRISLLEVAQPSSPLLKLGHDLYFRRVVPLIGAALSDASAYRYLPASTSYLPDGEVLAAMLTERGFHQVRNCGMSLGAVQLITATRS